MDSFTVKLHWYICVTLSIYSYALKLFRNTDLKTKLIIRVTSVKKLGIETNNGQSN